MPVPDSTDSRQIERVLAESAVRVLGRMPWSSNATLLCELIEPDTAEFDDDGGPSGEVVGRAIYKPLAGERPLWDFPDGLYQREIAAYDVSCALGWDLVPPTIERDGPHGVGSLQWFIAADYDEHYFTLLDDETFHPQFRRLAAFDILINSTDRKAGHILRDERDHLWAIDNGLCLHAEFKVRTVIWEFAGEPLTDDLVEALDRFVNTDLPESLPAVLDVFEQDALLTRARALLAEGRLPNDPTGRRFPWPLV